jgi:hypothetical protein
VTQSSPANVLEVGSSTVTRSESCPTTEIHPRTRLQGGICKPKVYTDDTIRYNYLASIASEPRDIAEALSNINWKMLWIMSLVF